MSQRTAQDLMRIRHAHVIQEDARLRDVALQFLISDCDLMVVTDADGRLTGVLSECSVVRALLSSPPESMTISSLVMHHAESVRQSTSLTTVLPLFRASAHTALPVVDEQNRVCGLLLRRDVLGTLLDRQTDGTTATGSPASVTPASRQAGALIIKAPRTPESMPGTDQQRTPHEDLEQAAGDSLVSGPHFLKGAAARRVLWMAEDRL